MAEEWPDLPYEWWRPTRDTLHMYVQVIGKLRLALSPFEPQWAQVALYLTARGLATPPIPYESHTFDAEFDFFEHTLLLRVSDGRLVSIPLGGAVANFYQKVMTALHDLGISVTISETPSEVLNPIPFPHDRTHNTYEGDQAHRFWEVLRRVDVVMKRHRARFRGKTSLVNFFWGSFDLANTRFSGRPATPPPGVDIIMRYSEDAEQISAGFWPGNEQTNFPAFFAYGYPKPEGIEHAKPQPGPARWVEEAGLFLLPYETVRTMPDPAASILEFLESTYNACAERLGWSKDLVSTGVAPVSRTDNLCGV